YTFILRLLCPNWKDQYELANWGVWHSAVSVARGTRPISIEPRRRRGGVRDLAAQHAQQQVRGQHRVELLGVRDCLLLPGQFQDVRNPRVALAVQLLGIAIR